MNTYRDLQRSAWFRARRTDAELRAVIRALGIQRVPRNANNAQMRAAITRALNANPGGRLPQANVPWPVRRPARPPVRPPAPPRRPVRPPRNPRQPQQNYTPLFFGILGILLCLALFAVGLAAWNFLNRPPTPVASDLTIGTITYPSELEASKAATFTINPDGGKKPYQIKWTAPDSNNFEGQDLKSVQMTLGEGNKTITVTIKDASGTFATTSVTVFVKQKAAVVDPNVGRASPTTSLLLATAQKWISDHASEDTANGTVDAFGTYCDHNTPSCQWSESKNWVVNGPALLLTDPIGVSMTSLGWRIVKTYHMGDGYYGIYYCSANCISPQSGRAVRLSAPLP